MEEMNKMSVMKKHIGKIICIIACVLAFLGILNSNVLATQSWELKYAPIKGITDTLNNILSLKSVGSIMFVGAHPDDENNGLLVYLCKGLHVDTSYVVGNWGEGGDNWIGQELYGALGVLRSQELKSARMFDHAKQMYFGAYDFGYSISLAETLIDPATGEKGIWNPDVLTYNLARLIRVQQPDIIFSHHRHGYLDHGQHQATGYLIERAIELAANPDYIIKNYNNKTSLDAWTVKKFYSSWREQLDGNVESADLKIGLGEYNPFLGMSYAEEGTIGRNMHKCQKMVSPPKKGPQISYWKLQKCAPGFEKHKDTILGGIDTTIASIGSDLPQQYKDEVYSDVIELNQLIDKIVTNFNIHSPLGVSDDLDNAMKVAINIENKVKTFPDATKGKNHTLELINRVKDNINKVIIDIYGVAVDISLSDNDVVPGQTFDADVTVWYRSGDIVVPEKLFDDTQEPTVISVPEDWSVVNKDETNTPTNVVDMEGKVEGKIFSYTITIPETYKDYTGPFNAPYNEHYTNPHFPYGESKDVNNNGIIEWNEITPGITTKGDDPYGHSPVIAEVTFSTPSREANYIITNKPELRIIPKISVVVSNEGAINKYTGEDIVNSVVNVIVKNNMKAPANNIKLSAVPANADSGITSSITTVDISSEDQEIATSLELHIPGTFKGSTQILVSASFEDNNFEEGYQVIDYPHIERKYYYKPAVQNLAVVEFGLPDDDIKIGYYKTGQDDFVMDFIRLMYNDPNKANTNLKTLTDADLIKPGIELRKEFDTIIVGKMGMETKEALRTNYKNLIDFANLGGNLVVHYQNWRDLETGKMTLAPIPFYLSGININKEDSDVYIRDSNEVNPFYNGIALELDSSGKSSADVWNGWVQQRCEWTPGPRPSDVENGESLDPIAYIKSLGYSILFQGRDPGDDYERPAIIYKPMDNGGIYTYSAVVWERQLQALVPGAFKLYANLVSINYKK